MAENTPSDADISDLIDAYIESLPDQYRESAQRWLAEREAAYRLICEIEEKGLSALL